jgi:hypothetical protein
MRVTSTFYTNDVQLQLFETPYKYDLKRFENTALEPTPEMHR